MTTHKNTAAAGTDNVDTIKAAAKRMCASLEAKGHPVPHTAMLEALAQGLGLDNWRKLKAVLDAPRAQPEPPKPTVPPLGEWQTWTVHGIYTDNNQQYGDDFRGRTPVEAAYHAMMDRLNDFGLMIHIRDVDDLSGENRLSPGDITDIHTYANDTVLRTLAREAVKAHESSSSTEPYSPQLTWLCAEFDGNLDEPEVKLFEDRKDVLEHLTDYDTNGDHGYKHPARITDADDGPTPVQALEFLLDQVEQFHGGIVNLQECVDKTYDTKLETMLRHLYQVRAMCSVFETVLNHPAAGFDEVFVQD